MQYGTARDGEEGTGVVAWRSSGRGSRQCFGIGAAAAAAFQAPTRVFIQPITAVGFTNIRHSRSP